MHETVFGSEICNLASLYSQNLVCQVHMTVAKEQRNLLIKIALPVVMSEVCYFKRCSCSYLYFQIRKHSNNPTLVRIAMLLEEK